MKKILIFIGIVIVLLVAAYITVRETAHAPTPTQGETQYSSEAAGLSFTYKDAYELTSREDMFEGEPVTVITIMEKGVVIPDMSEGPVSIAVLAIKNQEGPLEEWVRGKSISNFDLSMDKTLLPVTVGGEPALLYTHTGLYENDAVAVLHDGVVYLFFVSWIDAESPMREDFQELLDSVTFL